MEGVKTKAITIPEHNLEGEAKGPSRTASTQESQSNRMVKTAWQNQDDGSDVCKQACQNGLESRDRGKDKVDGLPVESEGIIDTYL